MIQIDLPTLVKRLNLFSRQALEMAASECMSQQAAEITVSHVLIQMLAMPRSDLRVITRQGDIGMEELRQALTVENYTTARSADSYPAFSPMLVEWLKEGWLLASAEMQHSELRGGVLLLALLHSPLRYIPPAAARLLTGINRDRLQQDFVQWTQESAESVVPDADGTVRGFITGIACSVAVASALWWWQVYPVQQQLLQVNDTAQGAATVWMASPELENYERRLQQLLGVSPVQPLETGMQMMRVADSRWPESLQQQQASTHWNEALKTRAQSSPQLRGWLQTRQDLHAFADLVMRREKEGLTLSYIKNVIWQAERGLGQETPVESLLTQYQDARAQKQNIDALEKQINERLEGVLIRWLLLKNNVMPEAATGTTAEK